MKLGRKKGINLLELMIVVVIIGVLVGIAIPQYLNVVERQKASEAVQLLGVLRQAQIRYYAANGAFAGGASSPCDTVGLDVDWSRSTDPTLAYFNQPQCAVVNPIVKMERIDNAAYGKYTLQIDEDGAISCVFDVAVPNGCTRLGY